MRKAIIGIGIGLLLMFALAVAFSGVFIDSHAGLRQNESAAVGMLRKIRERESNYAAANPAEGFACQLQRLKRSDDGTEVWDPATALLSGHWSGYKFELVECRPEKNGVVTRYQTVAVPSARGMTGMRAFCTDETGALFYTENGSAAEYLSFRLQLTDGNRTSR